MFFESPIIEILPSAGEVRNRLGAALRQVELLRGLLHLAERAERYRERDQVVAQEQQARTMTKGRKA